MYVRQKSVNVLARGRHRCGARSAHRRAGRDGVTAGREARPPALRRRHGQVTTSLGPPWAEFTAAPVPLITELIPPYIAR